MGTEPAERLLVLVAAGLLLALDPARAEVVIDGTLPGSAREVLVPVQSTPELRSIEIPAERGHAVGANLFHSFERFSVAGGEEAVFLPGAAPFERVLARVTGGETSRIDGTVRSAIAGADLFLLNPSGIVLGPGGRLDVDGSVTLSSADHLVLGADGDFRATEPGRSVFAASEPSAFGFLGERPSPVAIERSRMLVQERTRPEDEASLSLVGGDLTILGRPDAFVAVPGGRIELVSVASPGVAVRSDSGVEVSGFAALGTITLAEDANLTSSSVTPSIFEPGAPDVVTERGGGDVLVRGGRLVIDDAQLSALTGGSRDGGDIDVEVTGDVRIRKRDPGNAAGLFAGTGIKTPVGGAIASVGAGGEVSIRARDVTLENGGLVSSTNTSAFGPAGSIEVVASESVRIAGVDPAGERSALISNSDGFADAGRITVHAERLELVERGAIVVETRQNGRGGDVVVRAGRALLSGDGRIDSSTRGTGSGGNLDVEAREQIRLSGRTDAEEFSGISTQSQAAGSGRPAARGDSGSIRVAAPLVVLEDGAEISAKALGLGAGGDVRVEAGRELRLTGGSSISALSVSEKDAGSISVHAPGRVHLQGSSISASAERAFGGSIAINGEAVVQGADGRLLALKRPGQAPGDLVLLQDSEITTSVGQGIGDGGNVLIDPTFLVLRNSRIAARAGGAGDGGNILIVADFVLADRPLEEVLDASSALGVAGSVEVSAPDVDLAGTLATLPTSFLAAADALRERCASRGAGGGPGSFVVTGRTGLPPGPGPLLGAHGAGPVRGATAWLAPGALQGHFPVQLAGCHRP